MLDSANTIQGEYNTSGLELDLTTKLKNGTTSSKKLKTNQLNRFWPQSLANIIQTTDLSTNS